MNKKIVIPTLAFALLGVVALTGLPQVGTAQAQSNSNNGNYPSIVQKLVDRFNLNEDEVQVVFDEHRAERHRQMSANYEERINQAVEEGKLTNDQKNAILAKHKEMEADRGNYQDMSREEHMEMRDSHHEEMEKWAEENNIELEDYFGGMGREGKGNGMGQGMGYGDRDN